MESLINVINIYRDDCESVYHTWFLNNKDRLKAFRTIRSGIKDIIEQMENNTFGNDFKGSSLEFVMTAITEQKQVFEGAAHAFFWKPKLRIPDIYENIDNQLAFARFLKSCLQTNSERKIIEEIIKLDHLKIKGLGPAVANILYFIHPTLVPPFNTAIVKGFNTLFHKNIKLGSWSSYLEMREEIIRINEEFRDMFSKDFGAIAGLLYEVGSNRLPIAENALKVIEVENNKLNKLREKRHKQVAIDIKEENAHSEIQYHLARLGKSLGYNIWIAQNDHKRQWNGIHLGEFSIPSLPPMDLPKSIFDTISLIDVIWLDKNNHIIGGFEVEKSTSIYSGILRLHDLSLSLEENNCRLYLVAPDKREKEIQAQLLRPALNQSLHSIPMSYILFSDLRCDCDAMCKFGTSIEVLEKIAHTT